jgi:hypothetical protein
LWADLGGADASRAFDALTALAAQPRQAVPWLRERVRLVPRVDNGRIARLIADLDSDRFETREQASRGLEKLAELAEPALEQARANPPSAEVRRRVQQLLDRRERAEPTPDRLRLTRALEALERMGTPEARLLIEAVAGGAPEAGPTRDAKASLARQARAASR